MRKIVLLMHVSLDGYVAGPEGEMDWIKVDDEMFEIAGDLTDGADAALYGRVTYQMMEGYWPTAGDGPNASKHDVQHSKWYNTVEKIVVSRTLSDDADAKRKVVGKNIGDEIREIKNKHGKDILAIGSPRAVHALVKENLIDDYWLFVNPVLIGKGITLFDEMDQRIPLKLVSGKQLRSGVICLRYTSQTT